MSISQFSFPTKIRFGAGVRNEAKTAILDSGNKRPLVVTDRGISQLPIFEAFIADLKNGGLDVSVFDGIWGNPVKSQVTAGALNYREVRADSIIGFGGGAALDVAKAIALMGTHDGDLFDYEDGKETRQVTDKIPYWIALPTTAGTGSEVGRSSVVSDDSTHKKKIIFSPLLLARTVFADPELTIGLPAAITAATGLDAVTHLVEAYLAKDFHPICDGIALEGLKLAKESLITCVKEPSNVAARGNMLLASMMGAIAFQKGLGVVHSCAHALSTVADTHHGLANGVMIDHALMFNIDVAAARFRTMARALDLSDETPKGFLAFLSDLKAAVGVAAHLDGIGIRREQIAALVDVAIDDGCHPNNPRPVNRADFTHIFESAFA